MLCNIHISSAMQHIINWVIEQVSLHVCQCFMKTTRRRSFIAAVSIMLPQQSSYCKQPHVVLYLSRITRGRALERKLLITCIVYTQPGVMRVLRCGCMILNNVQAFPFHPGRCTWLIAKLIHVQCKDAQSSKLLTIDELTFMPHPPQIEDPVINSNIK